MGGGKGGSRGPPGREERRKKSGFVSELPPEAPPVPHDGGLPLEGAEWGPQRQSTVTAPSFRPVLKRAPWG